METQGFQAAEPTANWKLRRALRDRMILNEGVEGSYQRQSCLGSGIGQRNIHRSLPCLRHVCFLVAVSIELAHSPYSCRKHCSGTSSLVLPAIETLTRLSERSHMSLTPKCPCSYLSRIIDCSGSITCFVAYRGFLESSGRKSPTRQETIEL